MYSATTEDPATRAAEGPDFISQLPNELLLQIFEAIPGDYDAQCRAFSSIARVCRQFSRLITPLLYRSFEHCCAKHLQFFGYTIFHRKDRAILVKHFTGRKLGAAERAGCNEYRDNTGPDQALVWAAQRQVSDGLQRSLGFIAYSLSCVCPNIQRLDVTNGAHYLLARLREEMDGKALRPESAFHRVHTLSITVEPDRPFSLPAISLLFNLPSLRALTVKKASLNVQEELTERCEFLSINTFWLCDWRTSTVEEITFEECCLPTQWIAAAIMSCKTLKHFHYEYYYSLNDEDLYLRLFDILANHQDSLLYLRINELHGCKAHSKDQYEPKKLISFMNYGSLTHLDIPLFLLSTKTRSRRIHDILPSTLQVFTLDIRSAREGFSDAFFIALAEATQQHLSSLKSVEVICRIDEYHQNGYIPLHFCQLRKMLSSYGVGFIYFLEFVECEFEAAYMYLLLNTLRSSRPDGHELADHSSLETGCMAHRPCINPAPEASQSKWHWGYMQSWAGPSEFSCVGTFCARHIRFKEFRIVWYTQT